LNAGNQFSAIQRHHYSYLMKNDSIGKIIKALLTSLLLISMLRGAAFAAFPDDFSDVTWIDPDISSWRQTAQMSANVSGSRLIINDSKRNVWPRRFHSILRSDCCNRSLWVFIKFEGRWYATTFEFMRFGQTDKIADTVRGRQIKRAPFQRSGFEWRPAKGEVYGFMTSGMARFNFDNVNVRERSNISLYRWEEGPTDNIDFEEVPRGPDGRPIDPSDEDDSGDEEQCTEPKPQEPAVNTHTYNGTAVGRVVVSGGINLTEDVSETVVMTVSDDRSMTFMVDDESFTAQVAQDNSFRGRFTFDIGGAGICLVDIDVVGNIDGRVSTGTARGNEACGDNTATFNGSFRAVSSTAPSFLDLRPPVEEPRNPCAKPIITPVTSLLLDE